MSDPLMILAGLILLVGGAELLVRSSVLLATRLGIPSLVIGLTIVAFGTSAPEVVASVTAALLDSPGIAVGNIVGSNITNGLLVAGAAALITPIAVSGAALKRDGLTALVATAVFWLICSLEMLNPVTGSALLLALVLYVVHSYRGEKRAAGPSGAAHSKGIARSDAGLRVPPLGRYELPAAILGSLAGISLLVLGGNLLVEAAVNLATAIGVSETIVGLTIVAIGTSLPELATSMLAAARGQSDIAIGNVIGSNIFNLLGIGGLTAILWQGEVPGRIVAVDIPIMLAATLVLLVFAATDRRIGRFEGLVLVCAFGLYLGSAWLIP